MQENNLENNVNEPPDTQGGSVVSETSEITKLEMVRNENLKLQLEILKMQMPESPNKVRQQAIERFNSMSEEEKLGTFVTRESSSKHANVHFNRTIWYQKPFIQNGTLQGSKLKVLVYAGQSVAQEDIPYLEKIEAKYAKLNEIQRKAADQRHFEKTGRREQVWKMEKPIQDMQTVTANKGITVS